MAKSFLRSGSLDDILALGEDGLPVYASALQLRETLRLRGQQQLLDCLAIPQPHEQGDRLDWYSPIEGKVISWAAASDAQRASALRQLEVFLAAVADISRRAQMAEKSTQKLFGMLLAKAIQFPDQNHVYLVGNKPVLTFWGFVKLDQKSRTDPLDCLRPPPEPEPVMIPVRHDPADYPSVSLSAAALSIPEPRVPDPVLLPKAETVAPVRRSWRRLWWILPALALLTILVFQIRSCVSNSQVWPPVPAPADAEKHVLAPSSAMTAAPAQPGDVHANPAGPAALSGKNRPTTMINPAPAADGSGMAPAGNAADGKPGTPAGNGNANTAPDINAAAMSQRETASASMSADGATAKNDAAGGKANAGLVATSQNPAPLTALRLPAEAVKAGSTTFLNGRWQVSIDSQNPVTGKAVIFDYLIKNRSGVAQTGYGDGIICRADVHVGLMKSGNLVIRSQAKARCSDGSTYPMPQIVCKQGPTGSTDCLSRYDNNQVFPTVIKRENEK